MFLKKQMIRTLTYLMAIAFLASAIVPINAEAISGNVKSKKPVVLSLKEKNSLKSLETAYDQWMESTEADSIANELGPKFETQLENALIKFITTFESNLKKASADDQDAKRELIKEMNTLLKNESTSFLRDVKTYIGKRASKQWKTFLQKEMIKRKVPQTSRKKLETSISNLLNSKQTNFLSDFQAGFYEEFRVEVLAEDMISGLLSQKTEEATTNTKTNAATPNEAISND